MKRTRIRNRERKSGNLEETREGRRVGGSPLRGRV